MLKGGIHFEGVGISRSRQLLSYVFLKRACGLLGHANTQKQKTTEYECCECRSVVCSLNNSTPTAIKDSQMIIQVRPVEMRIARRMLWQEPTSHFRKQ